MSFDLDQMYCGHIKRGDVFLAQLDGVEKPVVILQDSILNERLSTLVVAFIKPGKEGERAFKNEVVLPAKETGLGKRGICMLHKVQLVNRAQVVAKKGEVTPEHLQDIYRALDINLGRFRDKE